MIRFALPALCLAITLGAGRFRRRWPIPMCGPQRFTPIFLTVWPRCPESV